MAKEAQAWGCRSEGQGSGRGAQPFGIFGPHRKKKSCLGPHLKYTNTNEN